MSDCRSCEEPCCETTLAFICSGSVKVDNGGSAGESLSDSINIHKNRKFFKISHLNSKTWGVVNRSSRLHFL